MDDLDRFTADELFRLHHDLFTDSTATYTRMMDKNGTALLSPFGEEWELLAAHHHELHEAMTEITAELARRAQEAPADA